MGPVVFFFVFDRGGLAVDGCMTAVRTGSTATMKGGTNSDAMGFLVVAKRVDAIYRPLLLVRSVFLGLGFHISAVGRAIVCPGTTLAAHGALGSQMWMFLEAVRDSGAR